MLKHFQGVSHETVIVLVALGQTAALVALLVAWCVLRDPATSDRSPR